MCAFIINLYIFQLALNPFVSGKCHNWLRFSPLVENKYKSRFFIGNNPPNKKSVSLMSPSNNVSYYLLSLKRVVCNYIWKHYLLYSLYFPCHSMQIIKLFWIVPDCVFTGDPPTIPILAKHIVYLFSWFVRKYPCEHFVSTFSIYQKQ